MTVKKPIVSASDIQGDPEIIETPTPMVPFQMPRIAPALTPTYFEDLVHHCGRPGTLRLPPWDLYESSFQHPPTLCNLRRALDKCRGMLGLEPAAPPSEQPRSYAIDDEPDT